jgi:hypothetical protein
MNNGCELSTFSLQCCGLAGFDVQKKHTHLKIYCKHTTVPINIMLLSRDR